MDYTRSAGYLANPYKLVYVNYIAVTSLRELNRPVLAQALGRLEKRPEERNQFQWNLGFNQYLQPFDAALHLNYRFSHDDWGLRAHTFEGDWIQPLGAGWTVTPHFRYYSQSGADFYTPGLTSIVLVNDFGERIIKDVPEFYSSDHRLADFGAVSGGVTVSKQFARGVQAEAGFEYYSHQANLGLGGKHRQPFDDFDFWAANAALKVDFAALGTISGGHPRHTRPVLHHHANAPAGIMFDHTLPTGEFMAGYRFMRSGQAGNMVFGREIADLTAMQLTGCGEQECAVSPNYMSMNMHMLELMYAPTDWLTLMLMPQWVDMEMKMTALPDPTPNPQQHNHSTGLHAHQSGGVGDTGIYALFKLFGDKHHHLTLSLGGTAPTGDEDIKLRKNSTTNKDLSNIPLHYGMQLGSGTWDFKPSLTYSGEMDSFNWGIQATGTLRLENRNSENFAFGNIFQGSVWGGYQWTDWLSTTVRGVYTTQGGIRGEYLPIFFPNTDPPREFIPTHVGPFDKTTNYGGRFWDLGLGLNVTIPSGAFAGNRLKFEWLQPIYTDYNGLPTRPGLCAERHLGLRVLTQGFWINANKKNLGLT